MDDIVEHEAVISFITTEFEKRNIAVGHMVGLIVFKGCTVGELTQALEALKRDKKQIVPDREMTHQFIMSLGETIPFFMWDEQFLSARYGAGVRLDIGCPYFTEWVLAVIAHIAEHDSLKEFAFTPP